MRKPVDLVEGDRASLVIAQELLGVFQQATDARKFIVEVVPLRNKFGTTKSSPSSELPSAKLSSGVSKHPGCGGSRICAVPACGQNCVW